jgi:hypothetical protein
MPKGSKKDQQKAEQVLRDLEAMNVRVSALEKFLDELSEVDRLNFRQLVLLPNAREVILKCPNEEYRNHALLSLSIMKGLNAVPVEEPPGEEDAPSRK